MIDIFGILSIVFLTPFQSYIDWQLNKEPKGFESDTIRLREPGKFGLDTRIGRFLVIPLSYLLTRKSDPQIVFFTKCNPCVLQSYAGTYTHTSHSRHVDEQVYMNQVTTINVDFNF